MTTVVMAQKNKIHPHKFALWLGIGSILMMFAGLTSAYIVKRNQANWTSFELPVAFWYSTAAIIASSFVLFMAGKAFSERAMSRYRLLIAATLGLGVLFIVLQFIGFRQLWETGITLTANVSFSFLYVIVGLHAAHVIGGIVALLLMSLKAFSKKTRNYSTLPVEMISTYWHFVDILWIYLLIFLLMIR
ncbi:MAG TPA: cytochrome c oxidase subunit 3 [Ferruginibacter sp.]|nr:cytochrome c oxidase subunit 3 [Ferruginibacter sp.]